MAEARADYVIVDLLNFRGETRKRFMEFLENYDLHLIPKYEELYQTDYCDKEYSRKIRKHANKIIKEHSVDKYDKMYSYRKSSTKRQKYQ